MITKNPMQLKAYIKKMAAEKRTGDVITPREVEYTFSLLFDGRTISVLAYNLETVLAEKIETVLSRSIANTRPRDFYDIHILYTLRGEECNSATLKRALEQPAPKFLAEISKEF